MRTTNDLDVFIRPTEENAQAAFRALEGLGIEMHSLAAEDLLDNEENFRFGPNEDHVDILSSIGEMNFEQVWRNRVEIEVDGILIMLISKADLIANERQVGRLRDLADVEELERLTGRRRS